MAELILKLRDRQLARLGVTKTAVTIGRDPGCDLVVDNAGVSRVHASVAFEQGRWVLRDEGSANGVFLHHESVSSVDLSEGDAFKLGKFTVVFTREGGAPETSLEPVASIPAVPARMPLATTFLTTRDIEALLRSQAAAPAAGPMRGGTEPDLEAARAAAPRPVRALALAFVASVASVLTAVLLYAAGA